jgi:ABC-type nitrate/sulfonate/bicarbonate transport system permease component
VETTTTSIFGAPGILAFLLAWELLPAIGAAEAKYPPPASEVLVALASDHGLAAFWAAVGETMTARAVGLTAAVMTAPLGSAVHGTNRAEPERVHGRTGAITRRR